MSKLEYPYHIDNQATSSGDHIGANFTAVETAVTTTEATTPWPLTVHDNFVAAAKTSYQMLLWFFVDTTTSYAVCPVYAPFFITSFQAQSKGGTGVVFSLYVNDKLIAEEEIPFFVDVRGAAVQPFDVIKIVADGSADRPVTVGVSLVGVSQ